MIGSGRGKITTMEQKEKALKNVTELDLDGLVVIGGDDSNTNAAILAEYFKSKGAKCKVMGVPKTIDGDLKNEVSQHSV
jgi:diphosphate-dependent phosphofructokinase